MDFKMCRELEKNDMIQKLANFQPPPGGMPQ